MNTLQPRIPITTRLMHAEYQQRVSLSLSLRSLLGIMAQIA
jgi:hypothetical protein